MTLRTLKAGDVRIVADDHRTTTETGSQHYLRGAGIDWRIPARDVDYATYRDSEGRKPPDARCMSSLCTCCDQPKRRKGGTNVNHKFICADCRRPARHSEERP